LWFRSSTKELFIYEDDGLGTTKWTLTNPDVPSASETVAGRVQLATAAETTTGTDNTRAVHPAGLKVELDKKANLASPALIGVPTAPTAANGTSTTQIATTAFVLANAGGQEAYYQLNSERALANNTTTQSIFNVGATLESGLYQIEQQIVIQKTSGSLAPIMYMSFGGTATLASILYVSTTCDHSGRIVWQSPLTTQYTFVSVTQAEQEVYKVQSTTADHSIVNTIVGAFDCSVDGTVIPQIRFNVAPGPFRVMPGSYVKFVRVGDTGSNASKGTWT
jgi:hypothetical protein